MPYMSRIYHSKETIKLILTIIAMEFGNMHLVARAGGNRLGPLRVG